MSIRAGCQILRAQKNSFCFFSFYDNDMGVVGGTPHGRDRRVCDLGFTGCFRSACTRCMSELDPWAAHKRSRSPDTITINAVTPKYKIQ
jgi:hypothetical protein